MSSGPTARRHRSRRFLAAGAVISAITVLAACSSSHAKTSGGSGGGNTGGSSSARAASGSSSSGSGSGTASSVATIVPPTVCGQDLTYQQSDPDHVMGGLPQYVQDALKIYPYTVRATPWATWPGKKGPWKIGYIDIPTNTPWQANIITQLKADFATLKQKGLVTGDLNIYIQPSSSTSTPEQQAAVIGQMVRQGVDGIILFPADSEAETPAIDAAGAAGVPIVTVSPAPESKYAINLTANNQAPSYAGTLKILVDKGVIGPGKTINTLFIRGIPGVTIEKAYNSMLEADLKPCPGIKNIGTVWGQWNPATTKTQVLQFLASHPGQIDFVAQQGAMQAGVVEAFEQAGRTVPPMPWGGTSGGDLSWWSDHKATYQTVGGDYGGFQVGYTALNVLTRILSGKGPRMNSFEVPPSVMTNANIEQFANPGKTLTWVGDPRGPVNGWGSNTNLDYYFNKTGGVMGDS